MIGYFVVVVSPHLEVTVRANNAVEGEVQRDATSGDRGVNSQRLHALITSVFIHHVMRRELPRIYPHNS